MRIVEIVVMTLSLNDPALLMKVFCRNTDCAATVLKCLGSGCGPLTAFDRKKLITKFEATASFDVKYVRGSKTTLSTSMKDVTTAIKEMSKNVALLKEMSSSAVHRDFCNFMHACQHCS